MSLVNELFIYFIVLGWVNNYLVPGLIVLRKGMVSCKGRSKLNTHVLRIILTLPLLGL